MAFLQLLGAAFLGAVIDGLLLGHWYLTDRGLTRTPINRTTNLLFVGVGLETAALLIGGFGPTEASEQFNPLLTSAGLASWIALGMVGATGLIAVMIRATLKGTRSSAVQSATGFFYLAVITALTAEFAAKVTFLPSAWNRRPGRRLRRGGRRVVARRARAERVDHDDAGARHDGRGRPRGRSDRVVPGRLAGCRSRWDSGSVSCSRGHADRDGGHVAVEHVPASLARDVPEAGRALARDRAPALDRVVGAGRGAVLARVLPGLASSLDGGPLAAVLAWVAFVLANLPSANLAIAAGAVVGGAVWVALAWWTGGVLASLACHIVWTGMMVAFPVLRAPGDDVSEVVPRRSVGSSRTARSATWRRSRRPVRT